MGQAPGSPYNPTDTGYTGVITGTINGKSYAGVATTEGPPLVNDPQPWWGSEFDDTAAAREPTSPDTKTGIPTTSPPTSPSPRSR